MTTRKKKIILLTILSICLATSIEKEEPQVEIVENEEYFADYKDGHIYIGKEEYIEDLKEMVNEKDILVIDERRTSDPNMVILDSYKVNNLVRKEEILEALLEYEKTDPTEWNRTYETLILEWEVHNALHSLNYKLDHTTNVDLNNEDENTYNLIKELKKFFM